MATTHSVWTAPSHETLPPFLFSSVNTRGITNNRQTDGLVSSPLQAEDLSKRCPTHFQLLRGRLLRGEIVLETVAGARKQTGQSRAGIAGHPLEDLHYGTDTQHPYSQGEYRGRPPRNGTHDHIAQHTGRQHRPQQIRTTPIMFARRLSRTRFSQVSIPAQANLVLTNTHVLSAVIPGKRRMPESDHGRDQHQDGDSHLLFDHRARLPPAQSYSSECRRNHGSHHRGYLCGQNRSSQAGSHVRQDGHGLGQTGKPPHKRYLSQPAFAETDFLPIREHLQPPVFFTSHCRRPVVRRVEHDSVL